MEGRVTAFRSFLYWLARLLGDVQAVRQSARRRSLRPIAKRVGRRLAGKATGRTLGRIFPPTK